MQLPALLRSLSHSPFTPAFPCLSFPVTNTLALCVSQALLQRHEGSFWGMEAKQLSESACGYIYGQPDSTPLNPLVSSPCQRPMTPARSIKTMLSAAAAILLHLARELQTRDFRLFV